MIRSHVDEQKKPYRCNRCSRLTRKGFLLSSETVESAFLCVRCWNTPVDRFVCATPGYLPERGEASGLRVQRNGTT